MPCPACSRWLAANEAPIPKYPVMLNVLNYGAKGDGVAGGLLNRGQHCCSHDCRLAGRQNSCRHLTAA